MRKIEAINHKSLLSFLGTEQGESRMSRIASYIEDIADLDKERGNTEQKKRRLQKSYKVLSRGIELLTVGAPEKIFPAALLEGVHNLNFPQIKDKESICGWMEKVILSFTGYAEAALPTITPKIAKILKDQYVGPDYKIELDYRYFSHDQVLKMLFNSLVEMIVAQIEISLEKENADVLIFYINFINQVKEKFFSNNKDQFYDRDAQNRVVSINACSGGEVEECFEAALVSTNPQILLPKKAVKSHKKSVEYRVRFLEDEKSKGFFKGFSKWSKKEKNEEEYYGETSLDDEESKKQGEAWKI